MAGDITICGIEGLVHGIVELMHFTGKFHARNSLVHGLKYVVRTACHLQLVIKSTVSPPS